MLECRFNLVPCPLQPCAWTGPFVLVPDHCMEQHPQRTRATSLEANVCLRLAKPARASGYEARVLTCPCAAGTRLPTRPTRCGP